MTDRTGRPVPHGGAGVVRVARTAATGLIIGLVLAGCSAAVARPTGGSVSDAPVTRTPVETAPSATSVPTQTPPSSSPTVQGGATAGSVIPSPGLTAPGATASDPTAPGATASDPTTSDPATSDPAASGPPAVPSSPPRPAPAPVTDATSTPAPTVQALTSPADAVSYAGSSDVGALFDGSTAGTHGCSASVVDSPGRDLLVTAAHCVSGTGAGLEFVPGYLDGTNPYGTWSVTAAFADPSWITDQNPTADVVFLQVAPHITSTGPVNIEDVVGANTLGSAPADRTPVTVDGYAVGSYDRPITCTANVSQTQGYPTFGCGGFVAGTSGGPWLQPDSSADSSTADGSTSDDPASGNSTGPEELVGIIGGLNQGGCFDDISYSPPFDTTVSALWLRACAGDDPDTLPVAGGDGC